MSSWRIQFKISESKYSKSLEKKRDVFKILTKELSVFSIAEAYLLANGDIKHLFDITYISQPTFQRRIDAVSTLWINVEITLIRR